jgi:hypothetical protein
MADTFVFDMPVELGLELVAIVGSDFTNAEGELGDDVFNEGDGVGLVVTLIDFERPDTGCIVNGGVLVTLDRLVVFVFECQELNINLDLVTGDLLLIPDGVDFAQPGPLRQATGTVALENAVDPCI